MKSEQLFLERALIRALNGEDSADVKQLVRRLAPTSWASEMEPAEARQRQWEAEPFNPPSHELAATVQALWRHGVRAGTCRTRGEWAHLREQLQQLECAEIVSKMAVGRPDGS